MVVFAFRHARGARASYQYTYLPGRDMVDVAFWRAFDTSHPLLFRAIDALTTHSSSPPAAPFNEHYITSVGVYNWLVALCDVYSGRGRYVLRTYFTARH